MNKFKIYGNRGARGLINENTIIGHKISSRYSIDMIHMDVMLTYDKFLIVFSDLMLIPDKHINIYGNNTNSDLPVKYLKYSQLTNYHIGLPFSKNSNFMNYIPDFLYINSTKIPLLIDCIKNIILYNKLNDLNIGVLIEIKTEPNDRKISSYPKSIVNSLYKLLVNNNILGKLIIEVSALEWECLLELKKLDLKNELIYSYRSYDNITRESKLLNLSKLSINNNIKYINFIEKNRGDIWCPYINNINDIYDINYAHYNGIKVICWTNIELDETDFDYDTISEKIKLGIDGLITDRPDKLKNLIKEFN